MSAAAVALLLAAAAGPDARGALVVKPVVNGAAQQDGCTVRVYAAGAQSVERAQPGESLAEGTAAAPLPLPPGRYDVAVACNTERIALQTFVAGVDVKAGRPTPVPVALASGALIVHAVRGDRRLRAEVDVLFPGTAYEVARGQSGSRIELATGSYDVRLGADVDGEVSVVTLERQKVAPGKPQVVTVDLSPGRLLVEVTRNGRPAAGSAAVTAPLNTVRLKEFDAGQPVEVAAGVYDVLGALKDSFDFAEKRQRRVTVQPGKLTRVVVDVPRGTVRTRCELDGEPAPARVYGFLPGAEDYFNAAPCGQALELAPGKYHLKFVLEGAGGGGIVGGGIPEQWHRNVAVDKGRDQPAAVDFSPAELTVVASKNGEFVDAEVELRQVGLRGPVRLGSGAANQALRVPAATYDVEVVFPRAGRGEPPREVVRNIACQARRACFAEVLLERGTIVLTVFKDGQPLQAADVLLYKAGSVVPYVQGMSGDPLEVPPGEYVPEARHGDSTRLYNRMRVRAGSREERQVELE